MIKLATILLISTSVVTSLKGIPDSEDKSYLYEHGDYKCLSQKTLPKELTFTNTMPSYPQYLTYSENEDVTTCKEISLFNMSRELPTRHYLHIHMWVENNPQYITHEDCWDSDNWHMESNRYYVIHIMKDNEMACAWIRDTSFLNVVYKVTTVPNSTCNYWLCLGRPEVINQLHQPYPRYTLPNDKNNYYLSTDSLPAEFQATDDGILLDILKASQTTYTIHKTSQRPIQTIEFKTKNCFGLTVSTTFDDTCTISMESTVHRTLYYVNGEKLVIPYQPSEFLITFTYSTAYLYTFNPLGFYPLTGCAFDSSHASNAEYTLKVSYDKSQSLSCEGAKLRFLEPVAIKRWAKTTPSTTSSSAITATTTAPVEPMSTERPASTASTKMWAVVAVVCFAGLIVTIVVVLIILRIIKKV